MSFGLPAKTTSPPSLPALGPISMIKSDDSIVSWSCSTTSMELPISRKVFNVERSLALSLECNPIEGSSRIYKTPISCEPI